MGVLETIKTGCWCNRPSTCRRRASNVFSFFRCGLTSSGGAMLTDGNPCSSASSATSSIGGVVTASNALQLSGFFARRHRRSGPRVPSGRSSDKPRCPDGAASKSSAGGSRFFRPSVLPMPRQCGTCRRPAASRRTQGLEAAEHAILRQHAPSALRVGKPFHLPGDRTARSSGTQS
jgi:hypothetical protein